MIRIGLDKELTIFVEIKLSNIIKRFSGDRNPHSTNGNRSITYDLDIVVKSRWLNLRKDVDCESDVVQLLSIETPLDPPTATIRIGSLREETRTYQIFANLDWSQQTPQTIIYFSYILHHLSG